MLLDALGTLLELEPPGPRLREELASRLGAAVSLAQAQAAIGAEIAYYRAHLDEGRDHASLDALRRRSAEVLVQALPEEVRELVADGDGAVELLLAALRFRPFPDAVRALPRLRDRGARLVVVSNWDVSLHEVLDRVGLSPYLDGIVTSAEVGARKPDPAIFERALALAGVPASTALHVGDTPADDVAGARNAGIEPVLIVREGGPGPDGVRTIHSLLELR